MSVFPLVVAGLCGLEHQSKPPLFIKPPLSRFQAAAPCPALPWVTLDVLGDGYGVAQQTARSKNLQARILWIDGTANLDRINSASKIDSLVAKIKAVGFNTIVFDVKPIVGFTLYPSKLTEKLVSWRDGPSLPTDFDPLAAMLSAAKKNGLPLFVSMNAFSEGHRFTRTGPGYGKPEQQTVQYETHPSLKAAWPSTASFPVEPEPNPGVLSPDGLHVFTSAWAAGPLRKGAVTVVLDSNGRVEARIYHADDKLPPLPAGGAILLATSTGKAGEFLITNAPAGVKFTMESTPEFVRIENKHTQWPLMMNPHHPEVQARALAFVKEVATNYDIDGLVFDDRLRFGGLNTDFSDVTRAQFEKLVGARIEWPKDVFEFTYTMDLKRGIRPGKWYDAWMAWRAITVRNWVAAAGALVRSIRPNAQFGIYAGSWYGEYQQFGNNYAASDFTAGFPFMTREYQKTGFASELDFLITGCYYRTATIYDAMQHVVSTGKTVEAGGQLTNRAVRDRAWAYAGVKLDDYYGNLSGLEHAIQAACGSTQGVMVFDLSHRIDEFWSVFQRAFRFPALAPHTQKGLLADVRRKRAHLDALGVKEPPVFIREGAAGAGF